MKNKEPESDTGIDGNELEIQSRDTIGLTQRQIIIKRFLKHKAAIASIITLISIVIIVFSSTGIALGLSLIHI